MGEALLSYLEASLASLVSLKQHLQKSHTAQQLSGRETESKQHGRGQGLQLVLHPSQQDENMPKMRQTSFQSTT